MSRDFISHDVRVQDKVEANMASFEGAEESGAAHEKRKAYKWCIVPLCNNTSISAPYKVFVNVPKDVKRRNAWKKPYGEMTETNAPVQNFLVLL